MTRPRGVSGYRVVRKVIHVRICNSTYGTTDFLSTSNTSVRYTVHADLAGYASALIVLGAIDTNYMPDIKRDVNVSLYVGHASDCKLVRFVFQGAYTRARRPRILKVPFSPQVPRVQATDVIVGVHSCRKRLKVALLCYQNHIQREKISPRALKDGVDLSKGQDGRLDGV